MSSKTRVRQNKWDKMTLDLLPLEMEALATINQYQRYFFWNRGDLVNGWMQNQ